MSVMRLVVAGAVGRMGRMLIRLIHEMEGVQLVGALARSESLALGQDAGLLAGVGKLNVLVSDKPELALEKADGVIDFSTPSSTVDLLAHVVPRQLVHVIGTTGFSPRELQKISEASGHIPIVRSGNMSLGVHLLSALVQRAAQILGQSWDVEIVEMHHRNKKDAPSGTALMLAEAAAQGRGVDLKAHMRLGRHGIQADSRAQEEIGIASLRGGSVVGDHTVIFAGKGERLELTHRAEDREIFARGAVHAALWALGKAPGAYTMEHVLGMKIASE